MIKSTLTSSVIKIAAISIFCFSGNSQADIFSLDNNFGVNGHLPYAGTNGTSVYNQGIEVLVGNKIITLSSFDSAGLITQHLDDGTSDNTFGNNGSVYVNDSKLTDFIIQPDGKIVVVGEANISSPNSNLLIARYLANGMPDYSFGNTGKTIIPNQPDLTSGNETIEIQSNGGIVISGGTGNIVVARFTSTGVPDLTFGNLFTFKSITDYGDRNEIGRDMVIDDQDRILVAGFSWGDNYDNRVMVVRYLPDGQLDTSFNDQIVYGNVFLCQLLGNCGIRFIYPANKYTSQHAYPNQLIIKNTNGDNLDGNKILLTGDFGTARLTENGANDDTFGVKGLLSDLTGESLAVRNDNKIVILGKKQITLHKDNGQLDDQVIKNNCVFDSTVSIDFQNYNIESLSNLKLNSNEQIIIAGNGNGIADASLNSVFLAKYKETQCSKSLKIKDDIISVNPFVHPLEEVGPIWSGLKSTKQRIQ